MITKATHKRNSLLELTFLGVRILGIMTDNMILGWQTLSVVENLHPCLQALDKERIKWEWQELLKSQSLLLVACLLQQGHTT